VDCPGEQLLPGAALALDQHRHVGLGDPRHHGEDLSHGGRVAEDVLEASGGLAGLLVMLGVRLERPGIRRPMQDDLQFVEPVGFW